MSEKVTVGFEGRRVGVSFWLGFVAGMAVVALFLTIFALVRVAKAQDEAPEGDNAGAREEIYNYYYPSPPAPSYTIVCSSGECRPVVFGPFGQNGPVHPQSPYPVYTGPNYGHGADYNNFGGR